MSFKGERDTNLILDNRDKNMHSYTVQPMISRSGKLFNKVLIVMPEVGNEFGLKAGQKVAELERQYGNIEIYASTCGKMTSIMIELWFQGTFKRAVGTMKRTRMVQDEPAALVLADLWSGHSKPSQQEDLLRMGAKML